MKLQTTTYYYAEVGTKRPKVRWIFWIFWSPQKINVNFREKELEPQTSENKKERKEQNKTKHQIHTRSHAHITPAFPLTLSASSICSCSFTCRVFCSQRTVVVSYQSSSTRSQKESAFCFAKTVTPTHHVGQLDQAVDWQQPPRAGKARC